MNFKREFLNGVPYKKFKQRLGQDNALEYVFKLWIKCEADKSWIHKISDPEDLAFLMDAPPGLDGETILGAFLDSGLLVEVGPQTYHAVVWEEHNAQLKAAWENGGKGGRPRKERKSSKANQTEAISREHNSREEKESKGVGYATDMPGLPNVNRTLNQAKPNDNPTVSSTWPEGARL